jgi:hypothetical protein
MSARCASCGAAVLIPHGLDARAWEAAQGVAARRFLDAGDLVTSRERYPHLVRARREWWAELRAQGRSLTEIGRLVGRDHATVLEALRTHERPEARQGGHPAGGGATSGVVASLRAR